ncbi:MAG TPA: hypothetical protein VIX12_08500 [Candidatus Binataceae bacterium]
MTAALGGCAAVGVQGYEGAKQTVQDLRPTNLKTHSVAAIKTVQVDRIAVMPLAENPPQGGEPLAEGASEAVTAELYSQVSLAGGWDIIPQDDVMQAMQKLPPTTAANLDENALKLGKDVSADAVLYGTVERYKERVGLDYAAASPASVTFDLRFADMKTQQVIWTAKFAKSQKALSQNVLDLANFVQNTGRWVRAHEIALEGVKEAVSNLHDNLNLEANIQRFETGTYGQLKSGRQRYSSGPGGIQ